MRPIFAFGTAKPVSQTGELKAKSSRNRVFETGSRGITYVRMLLLKLQLVDDLRLFRD